MLRLFSILVLLAAGCRAPNLTQPTFGGLQLWSDTYWNQGWRVQRHAWTGHSRLLDPQNRRYAWGSRENCRRVFDERHAGSVRAERRDRLVILLHGLGRTRGSLLSLERSLAEAGHTTARVSYASTRGGIVDHGDALEALLLELPEGLDVDFVSHSLGGLVALDVLARPAPWLGLRPGRLVQLAPPNRGSAMAELGVALAPLRGLLGPALGDVASAHGPRSAARVEVGIIAASRGTDEGWNPLVPGDDDGVLGVEEVRLSGGDVLVVHGWHTFLMDDPVVHRAAENYLRHGVFAGSGPAADDG